MVGPSPMFATDRLPRDSSRRWADIRDGSDDEEMEACVPAALAFDDSYKEAPVAALEDSKGGLNRRLAGSAALNESSPKDFAFLFKKSSSNSEDASQETKASVTPPAWKPNVNAPQFIPTLSAECQLVGVQMDPAADAEANGTIHTPDRSPPPMSESTAVKQRRGAGKKRRPPSLQATEAPVPKRSKSEEASRPVSMPPKFEVDRFADLPQKPLPEASEEDWQRRGDMRERAIMTVKGFPEYLQYIEEIEPDKRALGDPQTPNPRDRTISKRRWKYLATQWRYALKCRYSTDLDSEVSSNDDWQSMWTTNSTEDVGVSDIGLGRQGSEEGQHQEVHR